MREATVAASIVIDMVQYLERHGHAPREVCRACGIDDRILAAPDERVRGDQVERLWHVASERMGDPLIGLHIAEQGRPAALDITGYVLLSCRTVGEMLRKAERYAALLNDGMRITLREERGLAILRFEVVDIPNNYLRRDARHVVDSTWGFTAMQLRALPVSPIHAVEVWFRHAAPRDRREYDRVIGAPLRFDAAEDRFVLRAADLQVPLPTANPALLDVFEQHATRVLDDLHGAGLVARRVTRVLMERLRGEVPPVGAVAADLAMSARHLQRSLQEEGTTYQALLDSVRAALARRYLGEPAHSVSQVAFLLGFSEPSAFHRAFKRWTGNTPAAFRRGAGDATRPG